MNGILNIHKPQGMTSFGVISFLRRNLGVKKMGHLGTLDPDATGVLPVCVGRATKAVNYLMDKDKVYKAILKLGIETDTADISGTVLNRYPVTVTTKEIADAFACFVGKISQIPPMYSALKVNGKKLCNLARTGVAVERKPRNIHIYRLEIQKIEKDEVYFEVHCSKGTYIRTLCEDIGRKLGCGGVLKHLIRKSAGNFHLKDAKTLEEVVFAHQKNELENYLILPETCFEEFPKVSLSPEQVKKYLNGVPICLEEAQRRVTEYHKVRVYQQDIFLGIGKLIIVGEDQILKTEKFF